MAATIGFYAGEGFEIQSLSGSGLGFYGSAGFSSSVEVGEWQGRTFITNGAGTTMGPEIDSVSFLNSASGVLGQTGSGVHLMAIPNFQATLNIRLTTDTACKTQNTQFRIYDRVDPANPPSGVVVAVAEIIHPDNTQVMNGSGSNAWQFLGGDDVIMYLADSPGTSGLSPNGPNTTDTRHDWFVALSSSPSSIGSKLFAAWISTEYL